MVPNTIEQLGPDPLSGDARVRARFAIPPGETRRFVRLLINP